MFVGNLVPGPGGEDIDPAQASSERSGGFTLKRAWGVLRRDPLAIFGLIVILLLVLTAAFAPQLSPYPEHGAGRSSVTTRMLPPSPEFRMGTDRLGRDVLSRVIYGTRPALSASLIVVLLAFMGMFLDGISIFLIFVPLLWPIIAHYQWNTVWFGVLLTLMVAMGQFTPPLAVNLMVSCRLAGVGLESTVRWVLPLVLGLAVVVAMVIAWPQLALWLPGYLGF